MHILTIGMFKREKFFDIRGVVITATRLLSYILGFLFRILNVWYFLIFKKKILCYSLPFISKLENDMQHQQYSYDLKLSTLESRLTLLASRDGFVLYDDVRYDGQDLETIHTSREEAKRYGK